MKTHAFEVGPSGLKVEFKSKSSSHLGHIIIVSDDEVTVAIPGKVESASPTPEHRSIWRTATGFPPRSLTEETIVDVLRERGGSARITDSENGWNIYDELAARLGVTWEARNRLTTGTREPAWRPEVGYCRKNLEQTGVIEPTEKSGRGIWSLKARTKD
jgi:hypothetical protein